MTLTTFDVLPAIDLRDGHVVRLLRGAFDRETRYASDPVTVARTFVDGGAAWLHVVDLDGARDATRANEAGINGILGDVSARVAVEVAGGLRTESDVGRVLAAGARRAVVGTSAILDPTFAPGLVRAFGADRIAVALDVRDGLAVGHGWLPGTPGFPVLEVIGRLLAAGVRWFEVTAIARDGTLEGPDLELLRLVNEAADGQVIASGGIASVDDLRAVRDLGCAGAIVGRALYEGTVRLDDALAVTRETA